MSKRLTWDEIVNLYPNRWVVVEDAELTSGLFIKSGVVIKVCKNDEIDAFLVKCFKEGRDIYYQRTTDNTSTGIITFAEE